MENFILKLSCRVIFKGRNTPGEQKVRKNQNSKDGNFIQTKRARLFPGRSLDSISSGNPCRIKKTKIAKNNISSMGLIKAVEVKGIMNTKPSFESTVKCTPNFHDLCPKQSRSLNSKDMK